MSDIEKSPKSINSNENYQIYCLIFEALNKKLQEAGILKDTENISNDDWCFFLVNYPNNGSLLSKKWRAIENDSEKSLKIQQYILKQNSDELFEIFLGDTLRELDAIHFKKLLENYFNYWNNDVQLQDPNASVLRDTALETGERINKCLH